MSLADNKRIARNTIILYIRMVVLMLVTLYVSRILLKAMGVVDYGIYNVIAGFVNVFTILTGSISVAISRFITFELGKKDSSNNVKTVFCTAVNVQLVMILIVLLLSETLGLWLVNHKLVIPTERLLSANYLYQYCIISFCITLFSSIYLAAVIAYEKMSAFAYIGILDAVLKLLAAFFISNVAYDKLPMYGICLVLVSLSIQLAYYLYCKFNLKDCTYQWILDKSKLKEILKYSGWTYIGASGAILKDQGGNILINIYYGPVMNASRGISMQVYSAVSSFADNFMTAIKPQIIKSYASGDYERMMLLISKGSRFGFFLLFIISCPIFINAEYILELWLKTVPDSSVLFVRLCIIYALSESISSPLVTGVSASVNIRNYQLLVGGIQFLNFPIVLVSYELGAPVYCVFIVAIVLSQVCLYARLYILKTMININVKDFIKSTVAKIILVLLCVCAFLTPAFALRDNSFLSLFFNSSYCVFVAGLLIFLLGTYKDERITLQNKVFSIIKR